VGVSRSRAYVQLNYLILRDYRSWNWSIRLGSPKRPLPLFLVGIGPSISFPLQHHQLRPQQHLGPSAGCLLLQLHQGCECNHSRAHDSKRNKRHSDTCRTFSDYECNRSRTHDSKRNKWHSDTCHTFSDSWSYTNTVSDNWSFAHTVRDSWTYANAFLDRCISTGIGINGKINSNGLLWNS
jgi:hypothetical protein